ncbi:hypothetical protein OAH05_02530, partial [bacterium]|nr:hypothetical protein [bacterium]
MALKFKPIPSGYHMDVQQKIIQKVAQTLNLTEQQVLNVVNMLDEGNTVPFITRYRKHQTQGLDEVQIRDIEAKVTELREIESELVRML